MIHLLLAIIYLAFISLGLPDALLGAAWPTIQQEFQVPLSYAGIIAMIISAGTVISSLQSDRLTKNFGTGKVTAFSVALTALALFGFSISNQYWMLCLLAIPYGLGAGSVDASINNYVALHYASRHMSWLHCMWGVGASIGPYIMSFTIINANDWHLGYRYIAILQIVLTVILLCSLPLWKKPTRNDVSTSTHSLPKTISLKEIVAIPGAKQIMITFFCYCALEQTAMLWGSTYLVLHNGISTSKAATYAALFCLGITVGRAISGFITLKLNDKQMIHLGQSIILLGVFLLLLPLGELITFTGLLLIGLGCAPIYPCIIHSTPSLFGEDKSQAMIGVQMASAYLGTCLMPPLFGLIANHISVSLLPIFLFVILLLMIVMYDTMFKQKSKEK